MPVWWFGFVAFMSLTMFQLRVEFRAPIPWSAFATPLGMAVFGYIFMKKLLWDLADEVLDAGDALIVRFGKEEERIPLANIMNVNYAYKNSPARVTLRLRTPGRFGKEVSFAAPKGTLSTGESPVIEYLIERVDAAQKK